MVELKRVIWGGPSRRRSERNFKDEKGGEREKSSTVKGKEEISSVEDGSCVLLWNQLPIYRDFFSWSQ